MSGSIPSGVLTRSMRRRSLAGAQQQVEVASRIPVPASGSSASSSASSFSSSPVVSKKHLDSVASALNAKNNEWSELKLQHAVLSQNFHAVKAELDEKVSRITSSEAHWQGLLREKETAIGDIDARSTGLQQECESLLAKKAALEAMLMEATEAIRIADESLAEHAEQVRVLQLQLAQKEQHFEEETIILYEQLDEERQNAEVTSDALDRATNLSRTGAGS
jgi:chromosome segregation ATPase